MTTMLYRLGQVLCWAFSGIGVLLALLGAVGVIFGKQDISFGIMFFGSAAISYAIGRACRYVLSGF